MKNKLKELRMAHSIKKEAIAQLLDVSVGQYMKMEEEIVEINIVQLAQISLIYNEKVSVILGFDCSSEDRMKETLTILKDKVKEAEAELWWLKGKIAYYRQSD